MSDDLDNELNISDENDLIRIINRINNRGYGASLELLGAYDLGDGVRIIIDKIPRKPYRSYPGRVLLVIPHIRLGYNVSKILTNDLSIVAAAHFFVELTYRNLRYMGGKWMWMEPPGQAFLKRNSVLIDENKIALSIAFNVPIKDKLRISGGKLKRLFTQVIPELINRLKSTNKKREKLSEMIDLIQAQVYLRNKLEEEGFLAFIAEGSKLPREGNSDRPLKNAIPFKVPDTMKYTFDIPAFGSIDGLAIEQGKIISFAGANFHGKTTIIEALMHGHYNHVPGDGREFVLTIDELPLIAVENRRVVRGVDISIFMKYLPGDANVNMFFTNEASGSTSQAASLSEAIEFGAKGVLIDEDSSAVNFLIKDPVLKELVPEELEPIQPLIELSHILTKQAGMSLIFATGALGQIIIKADTVYLVSKFNVVDKIDHIKHILKRRACEGAEKVLDKDVSIENSSPKKSSLVRERVLDIAGIPNLKVKDYNYGELIFTHSGRKLKVELREGIRKTVKERAQLRALAYAVAKAKIFADRTRTLREIVDLVYAKTNTEGFSFLADPEDMFLNMAMYTKWQLFYVLSRLRNLKIKNFF